MARLIDPSNDREVLLPARLLVGRSAEARLQLNDRRVSAEHAVISWSGQRWIVRDLGSRNGTWVDGQRLDAGAEAVLSEGGAVAFGKESSRWTLASGGRPQPYVTAIPGGRTRSAEDGVLTLPDADRPMCTIYAARDGTWRCELEDESVALADGQQIEVDGQLWGVRLPEALTETWRPASTDPRLGDLDLTFRVSRDEEWVELTATHGSQQLELGARAHHYLLLLLARQLAEDRSLPPAERGWVDVTALETALGTDATHLNVQIYRARKAMAAAGVADGGGIVERRRGTGRIRLGVPRVHIESAQGD